MSQFVAPRPKNICKIYFNVKEKCRKTDLSEYQCQIHVLVEGFSTDEYKNGLLAQMSALLLDIRRAPRVSVARNKSRSPERSLAPPRSAERAAA